MPILTEASSPVCHDILVQDTQDTLLAGFILRLVAARSSLEVHLLEVGRGV